MKLKSAAFFLCLSLAAGAALAQQVPAPGAVPVAPAPDPNAKSETIGDWQLRCQTQGTAPQTWRSCEILQTIVLKDQTAPFAQIAFGRPGPKEPMFLTVIVPINVTFPNALRVAMDAKDAAPVDLSWRRCVPAGCFASVLTRDDFLKRWRALEASGTVSFKSAANQDIVMPISFKGLAKAMDLLAKEP